MAVSKSPVACPRCKRKQPYKSPDALYWCDHCRAQFDDSPDEGGDYSDRDPSARLERQERAAEQRRGRGPGLDNRIHRHARGTNGS